MSEERKRYFPESGSTGGHPPLFVTADEMMDAVIDYLENGLCTRIRKENKDDKEPAKFLTLAGLALHLGFKSRQSLYDTEERGEDFAYVVQRARLFIENGYEEGLHGKHVSGPIFALKQLGWKDEMHQTITEGKGGVSDVIQDKMDECYRAVDIKEGDDATES